MKIYTRTGDSGETSLFGGKRVLKNNLRVATYGTVDELNSFLGFSAALAEDATIKKWIEGVQGELFALGAWLASPAASQNIVDGKDAFTGVRHERTKLDDERIKALETQIDEWEKSLEPMKSFILPGGGTCGASFHLARAVCRRAERDCITLRESGEVVPDYVIRYLNRLADAIFVLARYVNFKDKKPETPWL
jgi:cob(I)alamin adenosyltransferase